MSINNVNPNKSLQSAIGASAPAAAAAPAAQGPAKDLSVAQDALGTSQDAQKKLSDADVKKLILEYPVDPGMIPNGGLGGIGGAVGGILDPGMIPNGGIAGGLGGILDPGPFGPSQIGGLEHDLQMAKQAQDPGISGHAIMLPRPTPPGVENFWEGPQVPVISTKDGQSVEVTGPEAQSVSDAIKNCPMGYHVEVTVKGNYKPGDAGSFQSVDASDVEIKYVKDPKEPRFTARPPIQPEWLLEKELKNAPPANGPRPE